MKRNILIIAAMLLAFAGASFAQVKAKDGIYFAKDEAFASSGWKEEVVVTVKGGKIVAVNWNGVSNAAGVADKKSFDAAGKYGMKKFGKAKGDWTEEAKAAEDYLVKTQNVAFNQYKDAEGHTDAISGATIHVKGFFDLVNKALAAGPVAKGIYSRDGWYYAEQPKFDDHSGWKDTVVVTVVNGTVVDVLWNGIYKDDTKKSKLIESTTGKYGMEKAAKKGAWHVQAAAVEEAILKVQDPSKIALKADGTTDAISGASIHPTAVALAIEALKAAR